MHTSKKSIKNYWVLKFIWPIPFITSYQLSYHTALGWFSESATTHTIKLSVTWPRNRHHIHSV